MKKVLKVLPIIGVNDIQKKIRAPTEADRNIPAQENALHCIGLLLASNAVYTYRI